MDEVKDLISYDESRGREYWMSGFPPREKGVFFRTFDVSVSFLGYERHANEIKVTINKNSYKSKEEIPSWSYRGVKKPYIRDEASGDGKETKNDKRPVPKRPSRPPPIRRKPNGLR